MNFWVMLTGAVGLLGLQALAVLISALQGLRAEARLRWEALLHLDALRIARWELDGQGAASAAAWKAALQARPLPEATGAAAAYLEARTLALQESPAIEKRLAAHWEYPAASFAGVMDCRSQIAFEAYAKAAAAYNSKQRAAGLRPIALWLGYTPVHELRSGAHSTVGTEA